MKEQVDTANPFLTFAISLHDRGKIGNTFIRELLESINNQLYKNFEVVISDSSNRSDYSKTIAFFTHMIDYFTGLDEC